MNISYKHAMELGWALNQPSRKHYDSISEQERIDHIKCHISKASIFLFKNLKEEQYCIKDLLKETPADKIGTLAEAVVYAGFSFCEHDKKNIATQFVKKAEESQQEDVIHKTIMAISLSNINTTPIKKKPTRPIQS